MCAQATPLDQQFYEEGEYFKYEHKAEKPSTDIKASAALPSLEEQREEHYNKQGWYDPRYSRYVLPYTLSVTFLVDEVSQWLAGTPLGSQRGRGCHCLSPRACM